MAGILHALATAAVRDIELGGVEWRLRRVSSEDLARTHAGALAILPLTGATGPGKGKKGRKATAEASMAALPPEAVAASARMSDSMACAAVTHCRIPGGDWEPVTLTMTRAKADPDKSRLWIGDLTVTTRSGLFGEAMAHSTEDGEAVERLESFRRAAGDAADS